MGQTMSSFGIEEEFFVFDAATGMPADAVSIAFRQQLEECRDGSVQSEMLACQIEHATSVCEDRDQALHELRSFRTDLARQVERAGMLAAGLGTAPMIPQRAPQLADGARYRKIDSIFSGLTSEHYICGLHIHVSIPDREAGVKALNFLRPWLPTLSALGANSPYWRGKDSKFSSWRNIQYRKWSVQGIPPHFVNAQDYDTRIDRIMDTESVLDLGHISWGARLSEKYSTIELRVADAQMRAQDSVLLAVLARALVDTAMETTSVSDRYFPEILDLAAWQAAKHGCEGNQIDPLTGRARSIHAQIVQLLQLVQPALQASGDQDFVVHSVRKLLAFGNGAIRQRQAYSRGALSDVLATAHAELVMQQREEVR